MRFRTRPLVCECGALFDTPPELVDHLKEFRECSSEKCSFEPIDDDAILKVDLLPSSDSGVRIGWSEHIRSAVVQYVELGSLAHAAGIEVRAATRLALVVDTPPHTRSKPAAGK